MPVDTRRLDFNEHLKRWSRCRDFCLGAEAVRARRHCYLPVLGNDDTALPGGTGTLYDTYHGGSVFFAGTARVKEGLIGALFQEEPKIAAPDALKPFLDNTNYKGLKFSELCKTGADEQLTTGRGGLLVEIPIGDTTSKPAPFVSFYTAEQIINWHEEPTADGPVTTLIVLEEQAEIQKGADKFMRENVTQWRVLELRDWDTPAPQYWHTVYRRAKPVDNTLPAGMTPAPPTLPPPVALNDNTAGNQVNDGTNGFVIVGEAQQPNLHRQPLKEIPFVFLGSQDTSPDIDPLPLEQVVEINAGHFRNSAAYENGLRKVGTPTPYVFAADIDVNKPLLLGANTSIQSTDPNAKCGYLATSADQMKSLKEAMADKETQMSALGSRILEKQSGRAETATAVRMRQGGQTSVLETISLVLSKGMTKVLQLAGFWVGARPEACSVEINREFYQEPADPALVTAMNAMVISGNMSLETLVWNLQKAGLIDPTISIKDEIARIDAQAPKLVAMPAPPPGAKPDAGAAGGAQPSTKAANSVQKAA